MTVSVGWTHSGLVRARDGVIGDAAQGSCEDQRQVVLTAIRWW